MFKKIIITKILQDETTCLYLGKTGADQLTNPKTLPPGFGSAFSQDLGGKFFADPSGNRPEPKQ